VSTSVKLISLVLALLFVGIVLRYLVVRKLNERNSLFWLGGALCILALGAFPQGIDLMARAVGVAYAPALLFLVSTLAILLLLLHQSVELSLLQARLRELAQQTAVTSHCQEAKDVRTDSQRIPTCEERDEK
jgi:hypothetical protein